MVCVCQVGGVGANIDVSLSAALEEMQTFLLQTSPLSLSDRSSCTPPLPPSEPNLQGSVFSVCLCVCAARPGCFDGRIL